MPPRQHQRSRGRGPAPALTPEQREVVFEELDRGRSYEQVQAELRELGFEVSLATLKKYRAEARAAARKANPNAPTPGSAAVDRLKQRRADLEEAPRPALPPIEMAGRSVLDITREQLQQVLTAQQQAQASGDWVVAARHAKVASDLTNTVARLESRANENRDAIVVTPTEVAEIEAKLTERVRAALERPLLCAHCSRQLSIDWGGGEAGEDEAAHNEQGEGSG